MPKIDFASSWRPTPSPEAQKRIAYAESLGLPSVGARSGALAIVGGGPSINNHVEELKAWAGEVWAINGAYRWCRERGIDAVFFSIDPETFEHTDSPTFATLGKGDRAILATQVPGVAFDHCIAAGADVQVFGAEFGPTGATNADRAAFRAGFTSVTYFGCESCYGETTHAYQNEPVKGALQVRVGDQEYLTKPELLVQAEFLIRHFKTPQYRERSGGLLRALHNSGGDYDVVAVPKDVHERAQIRMKKANGIFIAMPCMAQMNNMNTTVAVYETVKMLNKYGIRSELKCIAASEIDELRNLFLTVWYDLTNYSHLLMVDADMGWPADMIRDMIWFNKPVMGTIYCKRSADVGFVGRPLDGHDDVAHVKDGFVRASYIGGGVMMISRDCITEMLEKMPEIATGPPSYAQNGSQLTFKRWIRAFDKIREPNMALSEDVSFCERWKRCGGEIWANVAYPISHIGPFDYACRYQGVMERREAEAEPAKDAA